MESFFAPLTFFFFYMILLNLILTDDLSAHTCTNLQTSSSESSEKSPGVPPFTPQCFCGVGTDMSPPPAPFSWYLLVMSSSASSAGLRDLHLFFSLHCEPSLCETRLSLFIEPWLLCLFLRPPLSSNRGLFSFPSSEPTDCSSMISVLSLPPLPLFAPSLSRLLPLRRRALRAFSLLQLRASRHVSPSEEESDWRAPAQRRRGGSSLRVLKERSFFSPLSLRSELRLRLLQSVCSCLPLVSTQSKAVQLLLLRRWRRFTCFFWAWADEPRVVLVTVITEVCACLLCLCDLEASSSKGISWRKLNTYTHTNTEMEMCKDKMRQDGKDTNVRTLTTHGRLKPYCMHLHSHLHLVIWLLSKDSCQWGKDSLHAFWKLCESAL